MEQCKLNEVNERIREAAQQAAAVDGLSVSVVERFLRTGDETWDGVGSGRFYSLPVQAGRGLHAGRQSRPASPAAPPSESTSARSSISTTGGPEHDSATYRADRKGVVQDDWQEVALREIIARTFILN